MKHNGIVLGPRSPLLTTQGARRLLARSEEDDQVALLALLVGPAQKGRDRDPTGGMIPRYPELYLLHHIPNAGAGGSRGMAGRMKAMGALRGMSDLHLPVMRGPFLSLYVELKRRGQKPRTEQVRLHERLAAEGNCVMSAVGVEEGLQVILGYLALPKNRASVRPVPREVKVAVSPEPEGGDGVTDRWLREWQRQCYEMLKPQQGSR